jgi:methionyl-tRNA formyltransferase
MSIVFMGSPEFAVVSLRKLLQAGLPVSAVVSQPDRPRGRGRKVQPTAVSAFAQQEQIPLFRPQRLRNEEIRMQLSSFNPDLFIVVAYRILPRAMLAVPHRGSINLHGSLLPHYRGAAPIQHALLNGDVQTGLTTFLLDERIDTGGILQQEQVVIHPDDDYGSLQSRMAEQGARLLLESVQQYLAGDLQPVSQPAGEYTAAPKIGTADRLLSWQQSANMLNNRIRALSPVPGAHCHLDNNQLTLFAAEVVEQTITEMPGTILQTGKNGILVACTKNALLIKELQLKGRKRMAASSFLNGYKLSPGMILSDGVTG